MPTSLSQKRTTILIVTPYLAGANNGNWRTARRWQQMLESTFRVIVQSAWPLADADEHIDAMIALHARRSAESIAAFRRDCPAKPLIVTMTGTDLYRDLAESEAAQRSLELADALIVLQEDAVRHVPLAHRRKTHVVFQSAPALAPAAKADDRVNIVVVGHLREEKNPETIFKLVERLATLSLPVHITHIGAPLDAAIAAQARQLSEQHRFYHWAAALPHGLTRAAIKRAHLLVHPSRMEGGANVIVEAITSGTAVLASRMSGNVGMLGEQYSGYFEVDDQAGLLSLIQRYLRDANYRARLNTQCQARRSLFLPETERATMINIVNALVAAK
jgi:putative glycosyltransferase (TIGR04348 family)